MNKNRLTKNIATKMGTTHVQAKLFLNTLEEVMKEELGNKEDITLQGFGTFVPWEQAERSGRNPRTGITYPIRQRTSVKFKPGKFLIEALNKKK